MTAVIQTTPNEINFLGDEHNNGFKVRYNNEVRRIDTIGLVSGTTGKSRKASSKILVNLQTNHPRVSQKLTFSKFGGLRQKTLGCDMDTAIQIVMLLPGRAAATFREQCARTIRRVMAGDESLVAEIRENAEKTDDVTRLMQAQTERESGSSSRVASRDDEWYDTREIQQKSAHHDRIKAMKLRFPGAGLWQHIQWHTSISEAVTGMTPKKFSEATGAPAKKRRDYYSSKMLHMVAIMDITATNMFESRQELPTWKSVQNEFKTLCGDTTDFSKRIGIHGSELNHVPERPVLTHAQAMRERMIPN